MSEPVIAPVDEYRQVVEELERGIRPLATSVDGRQFGFQASLHGLALQTGGYVVLEQDGRTTFGQILSLRPDTADFPRPGSAAPSSRVTIRLARVRASSSTGTARPSTTHGLGLRRRQRWARGSSACDPASALAIGDLLLAPGVPAALDAGGFNRHTFMCGQSGSGKTYCSGWSSSRSRLTSLRMVILAPTPTTSDSPRSGTPPIRRPHGVRLRGCRRVRLAERSRADLRSAPFADIDSAAQAALLGLDPVRDREEYAALSGILAGSRKGQALVSGLDALLSSDNPDVHQLGLRAANLGVLSGPSGARGRDARSSTA